MTNNTSFSTTGKTPNEIAYRFSPRRPLDLLFNSILSNIFQAHTDAADAISFVLINRRTNYNQKHQLLVMKIEDWAMLKLHKQYFIPFSAGVTKNLIQQYVDLFQVIREVGCLAHKLEVLSDCRIHFVFFVPQLEPAPSPIKDLFGRLHPQ